MAASEVGARKTASRLIGTLLSQDVFTVNPLDIAKTRVTMTLLGGKIVYTAP